MDLQDGPHLFWKNDHEATVRYFGLSNGERVTTSQKYNFPNQDCSFPGNDTSERTYTFRKNKSENLSEWQGVSRILALGDLHGNYPALVQLLTNQKVIDREGNWTWGNNHLIFCGDVFDRGNQVTACLWLIRQLQDQAEDAGGKVHYLLGNHEIMAMEADYRYLSSEYQSIYQEPNPTYSRIIRPESEFGRWLRSRNSIIKINDTIFVHAGISPYLLKKSLKLQEINESVRGLLQETLIEHEFLLDAEGPLWYRGYLLNWMGYSRPSQAKIEETLHFYEAEHLVFAHTEVKHIQYLYERKLIAIDVHLIKTDQEETGEALLISPEGKFIADIDGSLVELE